MCPQGRTVQGWNVLSKQIQHSVLLSIVVGVVVVTARGPGAGGIYVYVQQ